MKLNHKLMISSVLSAIALYGCNAGVGERSAVALPNVLDQSSETIKQLQKTDGIKELLIPVSVKYKKTEDNTQNIELKNLTIGHRDAYYYEVNAYAWQTYVGDMDSNLEPKTVGVMTSWTHDSVYQDHGNLFYAYIGIYFEREVTLYNGKKELRAYTMPQVFSKWYNDNDNKKFVIEYSPLSDCYTLTVPDSRSGTGTNTTACAKTSVIKNLD